MSKTFDFIAKLQWKTDSTALGKFNTSLNRTLKNLGKVALAAGAAGAAFLALTDKTNAETSKQKGLADALGLNIHKLRGFAGFLGTVGLAEEDIIKATQRMTTELSKMSVSKEVTDSLNRLGLSLEDIKKMTPQKQLETVLGTLDKLKDSNEAASIAQTLLGKSGAKMIGALRAQGMSIEDINKKYAGMNLLSDQAVSGASAMEGEMQDLEFTIDGLKREFFGLVGEGLAPLIKQFREFITENKDLIQVKIRDFLVGAKVQFEAMIQLVKDLSPLIIGLTTAFVAFKGIIIAIMALKFFASIAAGLNPIGLAVMAFGALVAAGVALYQNWEEVKAAFRRVADYIWGKLKDLGNWFLELLNNPFFVAVGSIFAPWLIMPGLVIKHWEPIKKFFGDLYNNYLKPIVEGIASIGTKLGKWWMSGASSPSSGSASADSMTHRDPTLLAASPGVANGNVINVTNAVTQNFSTASGSPQQIARETERVMSRLTSNAGRYAGSGAAI